MRRTVLACALFALLAAAGCLSGQTTVELGPSNDTGHGGGLLGGTDEPEPVEVRKRVARGRAKTATIGRVAADLDDEMTYLPENGSVRYVAARRHTNHAAVENGSEPPRREPVYDTMPVRRWARIECHDAAGDAIRRHLERVDRAGEVRIGSGKPFEENHTVTKLLLASKTVLPNGSERGSIDGSLDEFVADLPRSVNGTVALRGDTFDCHVPVFVEQRIRRYE